MKLRKDIVSDVGTAHKLRGNGASDWMREDDRDSRRDLNSAFDAAEAGPKPERIMIDATHLKAHRTAASLLKKGMFPVVSGGPRAG